MGEGDDEKGDLPKLRKREDFHGWKEKMLLYSMEKGDTDGIFSDTEGSNYTSASPLAHFLSGRRQDSYRPRAWARTRSHSCGRRQSHTRANYEGRGRQNDGARGEETGSELRLAMNGNQSARQIIVIRKTTNSTGHHKHKRRWRGGASRYSRLGHLPPEDRGISLSPLIAAIHHPRSTVCACGAIMKESDFVPFLSRATRFSTSHRRPVRGH